MGSINNSVYALNDLYSLQNAAQNQMNCTNDRLSLQQAAYLQNASQCNLGNALANMRPGMLIPYVGEPPIPWMRPGKPPEELALIAALTGGSPEEIDAAQKALNESRKVDGVTDAERAARAEVKRAQRAAEHAGKWEVAYGYGALDPYAGTRFSKVATETTADKLNAWYKRLEARVAEIEADDAVMGNREEAKWRAEMDAFKADLN